MIFKKLSILDNSVCLSEETKEYNGEKNEFIFWSSLSQSCSVKIIQISLTETASHKQPLRQPDLGCPASRPRAETVEEIMGDLVELHIEKRRVSTNMRYFTQHDIQSQYSNNTNFRQKGRKLWHLQTLKLHILINFEYCRITVDHFQTFAAKTKCV